ncbi:MAG: GatB/YqeY domain-containing protein [Gammaproteobacteria bacterium]|nr:GatB/YqeY domain-containing protein [Gammaproteobacteria bacterium]MBU1655307.1 GatB/YqeY domain-containing protein [Gammaproteobacteria bacterium]MBU1960778.1 GatB/YqeY domain-containing protein [Gammaproteobacteria bacterium]
MLKQRILDDVKTAMKSGAKQRLATLRLITAAIKQREVDERIELNDQHVLEVLDKMVKQRRESITQYDRAARNDLADQERFEVGILQEYLPEPLGTEEIAALIEEAIQATGAVSVKDMGKVMGLLKPKMQGRADLGQISGLIKQKLNG